MALCRLERLTQGLCIFFGDRYIIRTPIWVARHFKTDRVKYFWNAVNIYTHFQIYFVGSFYRVGRRNAINLAAKLRLCRHKPISVHPLFR